MPKDDSPQPSRPSTAGMTTKVVKGSLWTLAGQVAPLAVSLVTTPFTIRMLGTEGYGVFILIGLIPTYLGFADFGMGMASTKFGSEAYAEGDLEKEARVVRTAAFISLCTSVPIAALLMIFAGNIINLFNVPAEFASQATLALRLASVTFVINFLCGIFNTPQLARLRMDLNTLINATSRILGLAATPLVLYLGYGIVGAIIVLLIASLLNLVGHLVISRNLLPLLIGTTVDNQIPIAMTRFGGGIVAGAIAGLFLINAEKGVLAAAVSSTALAHYSVAFALAGMVTLFSSAMIQSLIPAFSQLQGKENIKQLQSIYSRGIRLSLVWVVPAMILLALVAKPFFTFWAGPEFGQTSTWPLYFLLFGLTFNIFAYLPHSVLLASGRSDVLARMYWIELIPYIFIVWILSSRYGAVGAAIAWSSRVLIDGIIHFAIVAHLFDLILPVKNRVWLFVALLIMVGPIAAVMHEEELTNLVILVTSLSLLSFFSIVFTRILDGDEIKYLTSIVRTHISFTRCL